MCLSLPETVFSSVSCPFALTPEAAPVLPADVCCCAANTSASGSNMSAHYRTLGARSQVGTKEWTARRWVTVLSAAELAVSPRLLPQLCLMNDMILRCRVTRPKSGSGLLRPGPQSTLSGWSGAAIFGLSSSPSSVRCSVWKSKRDLWLRFLRSPLGSSQRLPGKGEVSTELSEMKRWVGEGGGDWVAEGDSQMIVQRRWNLASFHTRAHAQNGVVGNSPQTIAVWHQATPFCSLLLLPTKQNASKFYLEPQTWELTASGKGGGEQLSAERSLWWAVSPKCRNHVEVVWFLFHFNHQSQRKTNNVHVPPGCLSAWVGTERQTLPLWSAATMPQSSCLFSLSIFYYHRQQRWKITGVSALLPFVTLTKSAPLALWLQNEASWFYPRSKRPHLPWHSRSSCGISFGLTRSTNTQMYCSSLISRKSSVRICTSSWLMLRLFPGWLLSAEPSCSSGPVWFIYTLRESVMFKREKALSAFTEVIINWRSFSYRQSGGLPENNRGKQFVHHHSDRHGISGKTSPSLLSCVVLLPLPLIFTHFTKVSLLIFLKKEIWAFHTAGVTKQSHEPEYMSYKQTTSVQTLYSLCVIS